MTHSNFTTFTYFYCLFGYRHSSKHRHVKRFSMWSFIQLYLPAVVFSPMPPSICHHAAALLSYKFSLIISRQEWNYK